MELPPVAGHSTDLERQASALPGSRAGWFSNVKRAVEIGQHYQWRQIARRVAALGQQKLSPTRSVGRIVIPPELVVNSEGLYSEIAAIVGSALRSNPHHRQTDLDTGKVVLLNEAVDCGLPLNWHTTGLRQMPHLWRFQLQYHDFLLAKCFQTPDNVEVPATVQHSLDNWVEQFSPENTLSTADAWHPFCISRRIPVWIWILQLPGLAPQTRSNLISSLFQQCHYLHQHLETDLGGNHLLENLTALATAGCWFEHSLVDSWLETCDSKLAEQLDVQILSSGEHYERSPMYHCQILRNLLVVGLCSQQKRPQLAGLVIGVASHMYTFLNAILHPDGEIPLFADSGFGECPAVAEIHELAALAGLSAGPVSSGVNVAGSYWVYRSKTDSGDALIFDAGQVAAPHLPAHAHCDQLNLELSVAGDRWIVDSGNYDYEDSSMRRYCRSSLAHNVMTIDQRNSCHVWSRFRMGRRGRVSGFDHGTRDGVHWAVAGHDGYRKAGIPNLKRLVACADRVGELMWLVVDHADSGPRPEMKGFLHLAPEIQVNLCENGTTVELSRDDIRRKLSFFGIEHVSLTTGWYCTGFGFREPNPVLVYRGTAGQGPLGWLLSPGTANPQFETSTDRVSVSWGSESQDQPPFDWRFR